MSIEEYFGDWFMDQIEPLELGKRYIARIEFIRSKDDILYVAMEVTEAEES